MRSAIAPMPSPSSPPAASPEPFGLYVHWPFCRSKCPYCDFNVVVAEAIDQEAWAEAYAAELSGWATRLPGRRLGSIFLGGGTPSTMAPSVVARVIATATKLWPATDDIEITLEANPTSAEAARFEAFAAAGVNRLSLGVQALDEAALAQLGRTHDVATALAALATAQRLFPRVSLDLIYARPGQTAQAWQEELARALDLGTGHLSLYQLTIEANTDFAGRVRRGEMTPMADERAAALYTLTQEMTEAAGRPAYEISNHAEPGAESRHNLIYWRYGDYLGIGPGAHGRLTLEGARHALRTHRAAPIWLERARSRSGDTTTMTPLSAREVAEETLLMGLRLPEGVDLGAPGLSDVLDHGAVERLAAHGLVRQEAARLALTREGALVMDAVIAHMVRPESP